MLRAIKSANTIVSYQEAMDFMCSCVYCIAALRKKIIEWFSPLNFFLRQADLLGTRQPGTGGWILETALFKKWKSGAVNTVWCRGMRAWTSTK
jgi:hypothetical protein